MKVAIGLILSHGFPVPASFVVGYSHLLQTLLTGAGNAVLPKDRAITEARVLISHAFPVDTARNEIVRLFLDQDTADYLLFLDTDMKHPHDLAHRLVRHGLDMVTARYVMRKPPFFTVAMRRTSPRPNDYQAIEKLEPVVAGLMPIDAGGAGALLLSRALLTTIRKRIGDDWFRYQVGPDGLRTVSEDMWCYEQAIAAGFQPWLDADLVCGHVAQFEVDPKYHAQYADQFRAASARIASPTISEVPA